MIRRRTVGTCRRRRTRRSRGSSGARRELIAIQQRIVERLKVEIEESIGGMPPAVEIYEEEYWRDLGRYDRVSSKRELVEACVGAGIVYCGDYHTLRQAQATAAKLLEEILARRPDVTVALEMIASERQEALDRYVAGALDDDAFLREIDYRNTWDFHWEPYRRILMMCRRAGLRVLAINSEPEDSQSRVLERDFHAAEIIARASRERPKSLIFVLTGDLHVARDHLPLIVESELQAKGETRRRVIVHQNAEPIYWELAERRLERSADVVRIEKDVYCVFSATPLVKLQSYLNWEQNHDELCTFRHPRFHAAAGRDGCDEDDGDLGGGTDFAEKMRDLVETIAELLEIDPKGLDDFSLYTSGDLDFLARLRRDGRFRPAEIAEIKRQVLSNESYFIPRANIIYLADLSTHRAAEEAAHFINHARSGQPEDRPREPRDAFYVQAVREALGFFGSRIIDHKRYCMSFQDFEQFVAETRGRRLDPEARRLREVGRLALRHRAIERRSLLSGRFPGLKSLYRREPEVIGSVAHALGYILGDKLYQALEMGRVSKRYVRELFCDPLLPGTAEARYRELCERLADVDHGVPAALERLARPA